MAQIAIPHKLLPLVAACEAAYADASRKGYAKSPDVVAAVADLQSAYKALAIANVNLTTARGLFAIAFATLRAHRASRAVRRACVKIDIGASICGRSPRRSISGVIWFNIPGN